MRWQRISRTDDGQEVWILTDFEGDLRLADLAPQVLSEQEEKFTDETDQAVLGGAANDLLQQVMEWVSASTPSFGELEDGRNFAETVGFYILAAKALRERAAQLATQRKEPNKNAREDAKASALLCIQACLRADDIDIASVKDAPPDQIIVTAVADGRSCRIITTVEGEARILEVGPDAVS